jgi:hypothetical protein
MIDYAEAILKIKIGEKDLHNLLLSSKLDEAENRADDMIIALIEVKQWIRGKRENHK